MYVRMITYHLKPDVSRKVVTTTYDDILGMMRDQNGFEGSALLLDEEARRVISLTYWLDEGCAGRAGEYLLPTLFERTTDLSDRPPQITGYELVDHDLKSG